jgi:hypothetical protein
MDKIILKQNGGYGCDLWVTPMMEKLVNEIDCSLCEYSVGLVPAGYYSLPEECARGEFGYIGNVGCRGSTGPSGWSEPDTYILKKPFNENTQTLYCTFNCNPTINDTLDQIKELVSELYITPGNNWRIHTAYTSKENYIYENIIENYYLCKNEKFDDVFEKLNTFGLELTIDDIIDLNIGDQNTHHSPYIEYNSTFTHVSRDMPIDPNVLLKTILHQYNKMVGISSYSIMLNIIATDIEINYDKIIQLVKLISEHALAK